MKGKKLSLAERIALAASGSQEDDYPEDIEYDTSAKVVEPDEDEDNLPEVRPRRSSLRTKNVKLLDELDTRYAGEKVSRKKLVKKDAISSSKNIGAFEERTEDSDDSIEDDEQDNDVSDVDDGEASENDDINVSNDLEEDGDSEDEDGEDNDIEEMDSDDVDGNSENEEDEERSESGVQTLSLRDKEAEIEKGRATLNQIRIWDSLLEVRIRLQKMLLDCNRLPSAADFDLLTRETATRSSGVLKMMEKSQDATKVLMHELLRLQEILINQNSETKSAIESKAETKESINDDPMNEEITSEEEDGEEGGEPVATPSPVRKRKNPAALLDNAKKLKPEEFLQSSENSFASLKLYRNQTIQKWNDKTQFAVGKFNRKASSHQISTLKQIEQILSNKDRLLKRTQIKRSKYSVIGKKESEKEIADEESQELDPEIFDDDDFYHQLLRELIERKTANVNDPIQLSHHWLELQKLRTKLKKKVDTKASKGRKIRYDVHSKLVNFMAPQDNCTMSIAAVKELFGSLFGKTKD